VPDGNDCPHDGSVIPIGLQILHKRS
jgi:hypothetical protein